MRCVGVRCGGERCGTGVDRLLANQKTLIYIYFLDYGPVHSHLHLCLFFL